MKCIVRRLLCVLPLLAITTAGEIYVEVKDEAGQPKEGAKVQLALADGEETVPVKTNKEGVAFLAWKTDMKRGRILVDGSAQYAGTIPLRISFKLWGKPDKD